MSKHEKQVRRTRRKDEQRRRSWGLKPGGAAALAAAAAIAAGTSTYAEPVRFDNPAGPGHFDWMAGADADLVWLDLTLPASGQPGSEVQSALGQYIVPGTKSLVSGAAVEIGGPYGLFALGHAKNDLIPSGAAFGGTGYVYYSGFNSQLPEGQQTYLGVCFDLGAGMQYGWVSVTRTGLELDTFAWGYETEPGVAIAAGALEPGSLALLAMGAVGVLSRRRR